MTSPIGRTVGRTCSETGTSLTVYFASVVTLVSELEAGGGVVVVIVGVAAGAGLVAGVVAADGGLAI